MPPIFHERQLGTMCAQHCLNALLQAPVFSGNDLRKIAAQLDEVERLKMAENGTDTDDYRQYMESSKTSGNIDSRGFISIQVINKALAEWQLELIAFQSKSDEAAHQARLYPARQDAYICNVDEHWFTLRKVAGQWYNLNSMIEQPVKLSDYDLAKALEGLVLNRFPVFVVSGQLPPINELQMSYLPSNKYERDTFSFINSSSSSLSSPPSSSSSPSPPPPPSLSSFKATKDDDMETARELSRAEYYEDLNIDENEKLRRSIQLSMENHY